MKKIVCVLLFLAVAKAQAQRSILDRVIDKAIDRTEKKVEERIDRKIDTLIDNGLNKLESPKEKNTKEGSVKPPSKNNSSKSKLLITEPFPKMSLSMLLEFPSKPSENNTVNYYLNDYECAFEMKPVQKQSEMDRMIMNFQERKATMLMTDKKGKKTGMVIDLSFIDKMADYASSKSDDKNESNEKTSFQQTNEYKTIEGYKCRKYIHETEDYTQDIWVTNDVKFDYSSLRLAMMSSFANSKYKGQKDYFNSSINGMMIQTHLKPKSKKETETIMTMKKIQLGLAPAEKFATTGYEITEMPSLQSILKGREN